VILITGSHDPVIDYIADMMRDDTIAISSSHVGSMGGLLALKRGYCHLAPMHLLADDGEYNIPYLKEYFPEEELVLICIAERIQGIVSRDNLSFDSILTGRFINRQRGSGTRMLLDHLLKENGIRPDQIDGYDKDVTTHLAVCLAIQNKDADLGMAILSAARTFSLSFVPVGVERYELVTTKKMYEADDRIRKIRDLIASDSFKSLLSRLGGYETTRSGTIRYCNRDK
jgi:putative molybdopterin biosynthesis protein